MATVKGKSTTAAKTATKSASSEGLKQAYCMATKQKEDVVSGEIVKTEKGQFILKGQTAEKHNVSLILGAADAEALVKAKTYKKGY
jgi:hypothetical protein